MKNKKTFSTAIVILVSIIVLIFIYNLIINKSIVNQGKFRVVDSVLSCTADITSNSSANNALSFSANQINDLAFLIQTTEGANVEEIYIKDIKTRNKLQKIYMCQKGKEANLVLNIKKIILDWKLNENNQILIETQIINKEIVQNYILNEKSKILIHDGTALGLAGLNYKNLEFETEFKLCIIEKSGKINELKVKLKLPKQELLDKGIYVERMDLSNFVFRVK